MVQISKNRGTETSTGNNLPRDPNILSKGGPSHLLLRLSQIRNHQPKPCTPDRIIEWSNDRIARNTCELYLKCTQFMFQHGIYF